MNLTAFAIKNNRVTYLLLGIIIILGITGYASLPRDSMPPFTIRMARIVTVFPGASPERMELLVTDPLEKVVQEIPEVDYIESESRTGISIVKVALKESIGESELRPIWDRLRRKIDNIEMPSGITKGPDLKDEDLGITYGIAIGLENDGYQPRELKKYADQLRNVLIRLRDAAKVELTGVLERRVYIDYNDAELAKIELSANELKNAITSTNIIIPAGQISFEDERVILEPSGNFETIEDIQNMIIPVGYQGESVYLKDIANVYEGYISPRETIVRMSGQPAIGLHISLKDGANIVQLGEEVDQLLASFNQTLPIGITAKRIASQDHAVSKSVSDFISNLIQSVVIVLAVMLVFLGLRTGVVVASLIPATIMMSLFLMGVFNIGLNQVSLAALIMALGMLVDNAIVMAESMMVKMERGDNALDAAIASSKELMIPLLTSSLTTSAAFLSFFIADSIMGEIMGPLFSVITITLLSSWLMALTIVPMLAIVFIKVKQNSSSQKPGFFDNLNRYYKQIIVWSLAKPVLILSVVFGCLVLSLIGMGKLGFVFMPDSERNLVTVDLILPTGTSLETTDSQVARIERFISDSLLINNERLGGVRNWSSFIGEGPKSYDLGYQPDQKQTNYAHLLVNTSSGDDNQMVIDRINSFAFNHLPDAKVTVKRLTSGGGASVPIQIRISGPDAEKLTRIAGETKNQLRTIAGTSNVDDDWGPKIKKVNVDINPSKLSYNGLTNQDVALSSYTTLSGYTVGEYREEEDNIPIAMRTEGSLEVAYEDLEGLSIYSQRTGKTVPMAQVADISVDWQLAKIIRRDLNRTITVESQLQAGYTAAEVTDEMLMWLNEQRDKWGNEYVFELGGESEASSDAMGAVMAKLPISFFIIILLLVMQFNSLRKSSIVLLAIPFGIIGVVGGLLITGTNLSFTGFLGIISLSGIVINNAIVLLDRIQLELDEYKRTQYDAILAAAHERFRPILLTTFTTSLGLIPLWLGGGDMWKPLAIGIIFGLLFATVITLVLVPVLYRLFYKVSLPK
ncbi:Multidrug efflux pump subunit AcrB [Reichenbachiella agariperforans]|uniref:Multidrug efflux pump subunit AcrB n=1 Tax=Reichenbachiella agariperforans TaxID=156994 RepID=A0A1M6JBE6_REIAG|nr:efflux RND transporter permease subunit [Reichenbachiella agariperforans]SHJ44005.1 Multidrug efflux pump subunit AcrB [Reichenbachiella agariperforans]